MNREMKESGIEWIGEIPEDWGVIPHKFVMGKVKYICEKYEGEDIISLTMRGVIVRDLVNPSGKMPASFDGYQRVTAGNLLLCLFDIDVTPRCVGLIKNDGLTSPAYSQFALKNNNSANYYDYLLRMIDDNKSFLHLSKNLRSSLTETDFGQILTIVPSHSEQQRIADYLDQKCAEIDSIVENTKASIEEYKAYKQSVITEAVTKGLNPNAPMKDSGVEWIGEIAGHWEITPLKYCIDKIESGTSVNSAFYPASEHEIGVMKTSCVYGNSFNPNENKCVNLDEIERVKCSVKKRTIIVSRMNTPELVGACGYVNKDYQNLYLPDRLWQVFFCESFSSRFIWHYLSSNGSKFWIASIATGTSSSMKNITQSQFSNILMPLPELSEQQQIADYLDLRCSDIDNLISQKQQIISELETYKKSLIYECVTGKREV